MKINDIDETIAKIVNCGLGNVLTEENVIELLEELKTLRKAYEERPQGEWIRTGSLGNGNAQYECSNCHHGDEHAESQEVPYCWHCGAEMKGGEE